MGPHFFQRAISTLKKGSGGPKFLDFPENQKQIVFSQCFGVLWGKMCGYNFSNIKTRKKLPLWYQKKLLCN